MNSIIKFPLLFLIFCLCSCSIFRAKPSQKFFHGYINLETGEQLEGSIKIKPVYTKHVVIKPEGSKKNRKVGVAEIKDLKINLVRYGKLKLDGQEKLLEMVAFGKFNLYAFDQYYKNRIRTFYYFQTEQGNVFPLDPDNYNDVLSDYLIGVDEIEDKLYYDEVKFDDIVNLIRRYNSKILKN